MTRTLFIACTLAIGCTPTDVDEPDPGTPTETPIEAIDENVVETPGPQSRPVEPALARPAQTTTDRVRARLALMRPAERVVVTGTVLATSAERRTLPLAEAAITTHATVAVTEHHCGRTADRIDVVYAGGRLGDTSEFTSQMPRDLAIGSTHTFVLRERAGELVLEMGTDDLVHGNAKLAEVCR